MTVRLDHLIIAAHDKRESARFLTEILGLDDPAPLGPFLGVRIGPDLTLDYADATGDIPSGHYAFLVGEDEFDTIFGRIQDRGVEYWADPLARRPGEINRNDGGRGVYFRDPAGHYLELLTRRYGSGPA